MRNINLKYITILFTLLLTACSNDDDSSNFISSESIVGEWLSFKEVDVCSTGTEDEFYHDGCEDNVAFIFSSDGAFSTYEFYYEDGICIQEEAYALGSWSIDGNILSLDIIGIDVTELTVFEASEDSMKIGQYYDDSDYTCDGDNLVSYYYIEFDKL